MGYINEGVYAQLPRHLKAIAREYKNDKEHIKQNEYAIQARIEALVEEYHTKSQERRHAESDISDPQIIISESFI